MSILWKLKNIKYKLKHKIQRFHKGYADIDVWNFDDWFLTTIPKMLDYLQENGIGYPYEMTFEEWHNIINTMSNHFKEAKKYDEKENEIFEMNISQKEKNDLCKKEFEESKQHLHEGLKLLEKHFFSLWD